jgi:hypothetical protein
MTDCPSAGIKIIIFVGCREVRAGLHLSLLRDITERKPGTRTARYGGPGLGYLNLKVSMILALLNQEQLETTKTSLQELIIFVFLLIS